MGVYAADELTQYRTGRTIVQPFLGTDDKITAFCAEFDRLRKNFDSGMGVDTALVLSRTAPTIDAISTPLAFLKALHSR